MPEDQPLTLEELIEIGKKARTQEEAEKEFQKRLEEEKKEEEKKRKPPRREKPKPSPPEPKPGIEQPKPPREEPKPPRREKPKPPEEQPPQFGIPEPWLLAGMTYEEWQSLSEQQRQDLIGTGREYVRPGKPKPPRKEKPKPGEPEPEPVKLIGGEPEERRWIPTPAWRTEPLEERKRREEKEKIRQKLTEGDIKYHLSGLLNDPRYSQYDYELVKEVVREERKRRKEEKKIKKWEKKHPEYAKWRKGTIEQLKEAGKKPGWKEGISPIKLPPRAPTGEEFKFWKTQIYQPWVKKERKERTAERAQAQYEYLTGLESLTPLLREGLKPPPIKPGKFPEWKKTEYKPFLKRKRREEYKEFREEELIPQLALTQLEGAYIPIEMPPKKPGEYEAWKEEVYQPWVEEKEEKTRQKEYTEWRIKELEPALLEAGFVKLSDFVTGRKTPPEEYGEYEKWEEMFYQPWEEKQKKKREKEYEEFRAEELIPMLEERGLEITPPQALPMYEKWFQEQYQPALEKKREEEFEEFAGSEWLKEYAKKKGKYERFFGYEGKEYPEKYEVGAPAPFVEGGLVLEEFKGEHPYHDISSLADSVMFGEAKAPKGQEKYVLTPEEYFARRVLKRVKRGPGPAERMKMRREYFKGWKRAELAPELKEAGYKGKLPEYGEYEEWKAEKYEPWVEKREKEYQKNLQKATSESLKLNSEDIKEAQELGLVLPPQVSRRKIREGEYLPPEVLAPTQKKYQKLQKEIEEATQVEEIDWGEYLEEWEKEAFKPKKEELYVAGFVPPTGIFEDISRVFQEKKEKTPYERVVEHRKKIRKKARELMPAISSYESMVGQIEEYPEDVFQKPMQIYDYELKPLPEIAKGQPDFTDLMLQRTLEPEAYKELKKEGYVISDIHQFKTKKGAKKFAEKRLQKLWGKGIAWAKKRERERTFVWEDLQREMIEGAYIVGGIGLITSAPAGGAAAIPGAIAGGIGGGVKYFAGLAAEHLPEESPLPKIKELEATAGLPTSPMFPISQAGQAYKFTRKHITQKSDIFEWPEVEVPKVGKIGGGAFTTKDLYETTAFFGGTYTAQKALARIPITGGYRKVKIPTAKGEKIKAKAFAIERKPIRSSRFNIYKGPKSYTLFGKGKGGWKLGTPTAKISPAEAAYLKTYQPATITETKILAKSLRESGIYGKLPLSQQKWVLKGVLPRTTAIKPKHIRKTLAGKTKYLTREEVDDALKYFMERKGKVQQVYGTFGARGQMPTKLPARKLGVRTPIGRDIDVQTSLSEIETKKFAKTLAKKLRQYGGKFRVKGMGVEKKVKGVWHHAIDIKPKTALPSSPGAVGERVMGYPLGRGTRRIGGLPTMKLEEHAVRKGTSAVAFQPTKVAPAAHRLKDIYEPGGFINVNKYLLEISKGKPGYATARKALEKYATSVGVDLAKVGGPVKMEIPLAAGISPPSISPSLAVSVPLYSAATIAGVGPSVSIPSPIEGMEREYVLPEIVPYKEKPSKPPKKKPPSYKPFEKPSYAPFKPPSYTPLKPSKPSYELPSKPSYGLKPPSYSPLKPSKPPSYKPSYKPPEEYKPPSYELPSKPPSKLPGKPPSYKPSYKPPSKPPSYKPPQIPSLEVPYKPPYKPYKGPSYKPPSKPPSYKPPSEISYKKPSYKPPSKKPSYTGPSYKPPSKISPKISKPSYSPYILSKISKMVPPSKISKPYVGGIPSSRLIYPEITSWGIPKVGYPPQFPKFKLEEKWRKRKKAKPYRYEEFKHPFITLGILGPKKKKKKKAKKKSKKKKKKFPNPLDII